MFHSKNTEGEKQKHWGRKTKTLREKNKNTVGAIQKHWGSDLKKLRERESAPSVFLKMKHETKNEILKSYVSLFEMIDIQLLYNKKWNMKDKSKVLKTYGYMFDKLQFICLIGGRILTWGRRVPEAADKIAFYRVKVFLFELF